ncbi:hypothetical protein CDCA_CDCA12G3432 [Cyanidium caldarium]|uniref:5'-nucleotidase n=1 Tax=Cyanidium caldarium TaxID=2771 RepID=A0AAV9IYK3_CYACA|nr:hypothetical protein CDCA_CDCA12G3432 [Cyanidium caldarium]
MPPAFLEVLRVGPWLRTVPCRGTAQTAALARRSFSRRMNHVVAVARESKRNAVPRKTPLRKSAKAAAGPLATVTSTSPNDPEAEQGPSRYLGEIFCNRSLNMRSVKAVGFDMDYTLAHYKPETFERLAYEGALKRLVTAGYPEALLQTAQPYDPSAYVRGLMIDKRRGNVIKMDRHKYVKLAFHGFRRLTKAERDALYNPAVAAWSAFTEPEYAVVDTLFSLPDAFLFSKIVEYKDAHPDAIDKPYDAIYRDVRRAVDLCHRDGYIKSRVADNPGLFIDYDPHLISVLKRMKRSGRRTFLLTNSLWDYTNVVMNFLMGNAPGVLHDDWLQLFDVVIVGANKPGFLTDPRLWMYRVDPSTPQGRLSNTEGIIDGRVDDFLREGRVLQGGNYTHLHEILELSSGSQVLYVGDHMFSDILRSKRQLGWRTMLIIPELQHEIDVLLQTGPQRRRVDDLHMLRDELDEVIDRSVSELLALAEDKAPLDSKGEAVAAAVRETEQGRELRAAIEEAERELAQVKQRLATETEQLHARFHPVWGQLFKTGYQNSRFAEQVEHYACLYTSKVSNLRFVSPEITFRCISDQCPHDRLAETPTRRILERRLHIQQQAVGREVRGECG